VLIEIPESQIYWAAPHDISREDAVQLFSRLKADPSSAPHHPGIEDAGFHVGFADGRMHFIELGWLTRAQFDGMLTIAGGEPPMKIY
ncbi:MAG TPA: hypothetical protein VHY91_18075, partial [Pirellulales bacterium]|nr:hypothetical protein [Pirellulales bacterium]